MSNMSIRPDLCVVCVLDIEANHTVVCIPTVVTKSVDTPKGPLPVSVLQLWCTREI